MHIAFDHQIFIDELRGVGVVGSNTPNFCRRQDHLIRLFLLEECGYGFLVRQVQFGPGSCDQSQVGAVSLALLQLSPPVQRSSVVLLDWC